MFHYINIVIIEHNNAINEKQNPLRLNSSIMYGRTIAYTLRHLFFKLIKVLNLNRKEKADSC